MAKKPVFSDEVVAAVNYGRKGSKAKNLIKRKEFIKLVRERAGGILTSNTVAGQVVDAVFDAIADTLLLGHGLAISGKDFNIGLLHLRPKSPDIKKNFQTGETVEVPAQLSFRLRPSKTPTEPEGKVNLRSALTAKFLPALYPFEDKKAE